MERSCLISTNKEYRWSLSFKINKSKKEIIFIGLNPSLSDLNYIDNTTMKITSFFDLLILKLKLHLYSLFLLIKQLLSINFFQPNPTPLAIKVAKRGIVAKPTNSVVIINLNLFTSFSEISGNLFLLNGIAHKI